jgi:hypothetical protein
MKKKLKLFIGSLFVLAGIQTAVAATWCMKCDAEFNCVKITCPKEVIK